MMFLYTGRKQKEAVKEDAANAIKPKASRGKKTETERDAADEKPNKRQKKKYGIYSNSLLPFYRSLKTAQTSTGKRSLSSVSNPILTRIRSSHILVVRLLVTLQGKRSKS